MEPGAIIPSYEPLSYVLKSLHYYTSIKINLFVPIVIINTTIIGLYSRILPQCVKHNNER